MAKPQNATDHAWKVIHKVISIPAQLQGAALNAFLNTIDRAQTDALLRETNERRRQSKTTSHGDETSG